MTWKRNGNVEHWDHLGFMKMAVWFRNYIRITTGCCGRLVEDVPRGTNVPIKEDFAPPILVSATCLRACATGLCCGCRNPCTTLKGLIARELHLSLLGGPWDLVSTYNWTYNPTSNFPKWALYRGYPNYN